MANHSRREFLQRTAVGIAATTLSPRVFAAGGSDRLRLAMIGCGGRSKSLAADFAPHAEFVIACDPDTARAKSFAEQFAASSMTGDLREVLADGSVDAVVIATPDHWHAPAAIMACDAGKHVYVEKPCSHNLVEGRLLVDAARRNDVVVQHGTQSRTGPLVVKAIRLLEEGAIGDVLVAKAWNVQRRRNIGREKPTSPPEGVDYDTWIGPAEFVPFQSNRFHYNWHWWHNFGTGDIGNDGAHEMDIARWGLGVDGLPSRAFALGGKYYFDDDQQFPDTATCTFEWPDANVPLRRKQLIFEMRIWSKTYPHNVDTGIEFYGTDGMLFVSKRGKLVLRDNSNRVVPDVTPADDSPIPSSHQVDFLECIQQRRTPRAEIAVGHDSVGLIHLANASIQLGRAFDVDPVTERVVGDDDANALLTRRYRADGHWSVPNGV